MIGYGTSSLRNIKVPRNTAGKGKYTHSGEWKVQFSFQTVENFPLNCLRYFCANKNGPHAKQFPLIMQNYLICLLGTVWNTLESGGKICFQFINVAMFFWARGSAFITK